VNVLVGFSYGTKNFCKIKLEKKILMFTFRPNYKKMVLNSRKKPPLKKKKLKIISVMGIEPMTKGFFLYTRRFLGAIARE
jgi:hypothetical protein